MAKDELRNPYFPSIITFTLLFDDVLHNTVLSVTTLIAVKIE